MWKSRNKGNTKAKPGWTSKCKLPKPLHNIGVTVLSNGNILIMGGDYCNECWEYDSYSDTFYRVGENPHNTNNAHHTTVATGTNTLISLGGTPPQMQIISYNKKSVPNLSYETLKLSNNQILNLGMNCRATIASIPHDSNQRYLVTSGGDQCKTDITIWNLQKKSLTTHLKHVLPAFCWSCHGMVDIGGSSNFDNNVFLLFQSTLCFQVQLLRGKNSHTFSLKTRRIPMKYDLGLDFAYCELFRHIVVFPTDSNKGVFVYSFDKGDWKEFKDFPIPQSRRQACICISDEKVHFWGGLDTQTGESCDDHWCMPLLTLCRQLGIPMHEERKSVFLELSECESPLQFSPPPPPHHSSPNPPHFNQTRPNTLSTVSNGSNTSMPLPSETRSDSGSVVDAYRARYGSEPRVPQLMAFSNSNPQFPNLNYADARKIITTRSSIASSRVSVASSVASISAASTTSVASSATLSPRSRPPPAPFKKTTSDTSAAMRGRPPSRSPKPPPKSISNRSNFTVGKIDESTPRITVSPAQKQANGTVPPRVVGRNARKSIERYEQLTALAAAHSSPNLNRTSSPNLNRSKTPTRPQRKAPPSKPALSPLSKSQGSPQPNGNKDENGGVKNGTNTDIVSTYVSTFGSRPTVSQLQAFARKQNEPLSYMEAKKLLAK